MTAPAILWIDREPHERQMRLRPGDACSCAAYALFSQHGHDSLSGVKLLEFFEARGRVCVLVAMFVPPAGERQHADSTRVLVLAGGTLGWTWLTWLDAL